MLPGFTLTIYIKPPTGLVFLVTHVTQPRVSPVAIHIQPLSGLFFS